jgi:ATP-dependent HslUV protease ATP-binding subunit HslU
MVEAIARPAQSGSAARAGGEKGVNSVFMENLTPAAIVAELDKYIIGQKDAKRAVAVALRNRFRRQLLPDELRQEIQPKNILMIGPTGVGKTEIARRVARIVDAPFIKVEATKFTEVGYVGRDVESIVRDLVEIAISNLHGQRLEQVNEEAATLAAERIAEMLADQLVQKKPARNGRKGAEDEVGEAEAERREVATKRRLQREQKRLLQLLRENALEEETVEIEIEPEEYDDFNPLDFVAGMTPDDLYDTFQDFIGGLQPRRPTRRRVSVREARRILTQQEANRMVDFDAVIDEAIQRVEEAAVVFLDEIDKTISSNGEFGGADVSGEGVQRDLLPIVEGSVVMTRYGPVKTDHVLFIAAGAFHNTRPSDLIPELQGRFPIRVELSSLSEDDLYAILTEPQNALTKQYVALLGTEGLDLQFTEDGMREMARLATEVNARTEDIGARRLQTIIEKVVEEISFDAENYSGQVVTIDGKFVEKRVGEVAADDDLSNFIL